MTVDQRLSTPQTFGSASFMSLNEAKHFGLNIEGNGKAFCPYVGSLMQPERFSGKAVSIYARARSLTRDIGHNNLPDGNGHLLTIAPTRAGKGTGQIIPNLLSWIGSVLVIDIKGENYLHSAGYRATTLGQNVYRFAPFEKESEIWNPILSIRADPKHDKSTPEEEEDARYLTNLLISPSGSNDPFWENSAKNFLEGLLLYVRTAPLGANDSNNDEPEELQIKVRERSMREVRRLLSLKRKAFKLLLKTMGETKRPLINQAGNNMRRFMSGKGKTGDSILATALEQTSVWAYQRVHQVTYKGSEDPDDLEPASNDFSFDRMRDGKTSIYLIIPPDYLSEYRAILRVMIGFAMRELRTSYKESKKHPEYRDKPPILFILDEFPQLAYMAPIEAALLYLAGYDVRLWFFVQDISQLQLHYKDSWRTFFSNTSTQCFFGVSDISTANLVSEMAGMATIKHATETKTTDIIPNTYPLPSDLRSQSVAISEAARPLINPDEVMRMEDNKQIIFMKGSKPILCFRLNYYELYEINRRNKIPPPKEIDFC
jgi:type IV secretion system protein VirD4